MKPVKFEEANAVRAAPEGLDECEDLPIFFHNSHGYPEQISCWKLSFWERLRALFFGKVWLHIVGSTMPPFGFSVKRTVFVDDKD